MVAKVEMRAFSVVRADLPASRKRLTARNGVAHRKADAEHGGSHLPGTARGRFEFDQL